MSRTARVHPIIIPYTWLIELEPNEVTATEPDLVGAWSWDERMAPATARGWTHVGLGEARSFRAVNLTLTLESLAGVSWPSAEVRRVSPEPALFPSFTLYRGWGYRRGVLTNLDGTTLDQDHTYNNRGRHRVGRGCDLPGSRRQRHGTLGSPARGPCPPDTTRWLSVAIHRPPSRKSQGYRAVFGTTPPRPIDQRQRRSLDHRLQSRGHSLRTGITMNDQASVETPPDRRRLELG